MTRILLSIFLMSLIWTFSESIEAAPPASPAKIETVKDLFGNWDPRKEPLDVEVVKQWTEGNNVLRIVRYTVGSFKGAKSKIAAYYAFPKSNELVPGLVQIHGGGQRGNLNAVRSYANRGYACISVNWGGIPLDEGGPGTDWGNIDPTQKNVPGYYSFAPTTMSLETTVSARNNNWFPVTMGCRRALTFLEQQTEVDPSRLGVFGHSMGGFLAMYVAGTDERVKAAAPSCGGTGYNTYDFPGVPNSKLNVANCEEQFRATVEPESYAPLVKCPIIYIGATNDFAGPMDNAFRTYKLIPDPDMRFTLAPHLNHRTTPSHGICTALWFDEKLKGTFTFPATPESELILKEGQVPQFKVTPRKSRPIAAVDLYYSIDYDPKARYWRAAKAQRSGDGNAWLAPCPILSTDQPLFAFADVTYALDKPEKSVEFYYADIEANTFSISSMMHAAMPDELRKIGVKADDTSSTLVDDFKNGFHDWFLHSPDSPDNWEFGTRKLSDPKWKGQDGQALEFQVKSPKDNNLVVQIIENQWRNYRGPMATYQAKLHLDGSEQWQKVALNLADFHNTKEPKDIKDPKDSASPRNWKQIDEFYFMAGEAPVKEGEPNNHARKWNGSQPEFQDMKWVSPEK